MENFRTSLEKVCASQILLSQQFHIVSVADFYCIYISSVHKRSFYLFTDADNSLQVFNPARFNIIDKVTLFMELVLPESIQDVQRAIGQMAAYPPMNRTELKPIDSFVLLKRIAALKKPHHSDFALANSPQFHNIVFASVGEGLSIPLYSFQVGQHRTERIVNFVNVRPTSFEFFNDSRDWITFTKYQPENRFLIVTSDPTFFLEHLSRTYGPDYFVVLCHHNPTLDTIRAIFYIRDELSFADFLVGNFQSNNDKHLIANLFSAHLNTFVENLVFSIYYDQQHYHTEIFCIEGTEHVEFLERFVEDFNDVTLQSFFATDDIAPTDEEVIKFLRATSHPIMLEGKCVFTIKIQATNSLARKFLTALSEKFAMKDAVKIYHLNSD